MGFCVYVVWRVASTERCAQCGCGPYAVCARGAPRGRGGGRCACRQRGHAFGVWTTHRPRHLKRKNDRPHIHVYTWHSLDISARGARCGGKQIWHIGRLKNSDNAHRVRCCSKPDLLGRHSLLLCTCQCVVPEPDMVAVEARTPHGRLDVCSTPCGGRPGPRGQAEGSGQTGGERGRASVWSGCGAQSRVRAALIAA